MKFDKVQFIGMALCTTPGNLTTIGTISDEGVYLGFDDINKDIDYRIKLLNNAIKETIASNSIDLNKNTLKIFVVPEFYFRGNKGAYYYPSSISFYQKYIEPKIEKITETIDDNWIFVLGTLLTSKDKIKNDIEPIKSLYNIGDHILNVYYDHFSSFIKDHNNSTLSGFLKQLDGKNTKDRLSISIEYKYFQNFLKRALEYCESKANINVENYCYIFQNLLNNEEDKTLRVLKKHKSKEDFILNSIDNNYIQTITKYRKIPNKKSGELKNSLLDDYSIFNCFNILIGLDICLDHHKQRLLKHLRKNNSHIDVQIVTSCGMTIYDSSVIARNNGYVFICDGEYTLKDKKGQDIAENGENCHTLLKKVVNQINPHDKSLKHKQLENISSDKTLKSELSENIKAIDKIHINIKKKLYRSNQCQIHIYPSVSL